MNIEAMKQALEALWMANTRQWPENKIGAAINALSAAIAEAEKQEPVAYVTGTYAGRFVVQPINPAMVLPVNMALYTTPPAAQRQWVGLTDAEIEEWDYDVRDVVMDIEKLLRDKNT
jgi:hypothetical protein